MRKSFALLAVSALLVALGVAFAGNATADDPPVRKAATRTIDVRDNYFAPSGRDRSIKAITVRKNTIVKFVWGKKGAGTEFDHNVRGYRGHKFRSKYLTEGTYRKRFKRTTRILCDVHATTMRLTVKVK